MRDFVANAIVFFVLLAIVFVSVFFGMYVIISHYTDELKECAKQHNVYECELVAVPVEGGE